MRVFNHGHNSIEDAGHVFPPRQITDTKKKLKLTNPRLETREEPPKDEPPKDEPRTEGD